ncbi:hypothetical protein [Brevibacillus migulae]|uniref:hypothetical protein n=1 Tax=Brevibacillus migulae TaxID=1644114 RepID=UPI00106E3380|nr:hypothetical protein [Brevibacillus migulae]
MKRYVLVGAIFVVCFLAIQTLVQIGMGMYLTTTYVPDVVDAYQMQGQDDLPSETTFGFASDGFVSRHWMVWLISLGLSGVIATIMHRTLFKKK